MYNYLELAQERKKERKEERLISMRLDRDSRDVVAFKTQQSKKQAFSFFPLLLFLSDLLKQAIKNQKCIWLTMQSVLEKRTINGETI